MSEMFMLGYKRGKADRLLGITLMVARYSHMPDYARGYRIGNAGTGWMFGLEGGNKSESEMGRME